MEFKVKVNSYYNQIYIFGLLSFPVHIMLIKMNVSGLF